MLEPKELDKLYELLNKKEETLEAVEGLFLSTFADSLAQFWASYSISNLLSLNLLTPRQRIIALFLLIENFKHERIRKHPFGATILDVSSKTNEPFERKMIAQLIVDMKRDKYAKAKIQTLHDEQQAMLDSIEERLEIKKIREDFINNLPKISESKKSEVYNVVSEEPRDQPPEFQMNLPSLGSSELGYETFNVGFLRPVPKFIDISPSEFNWLSPGIIADVHWDSTAEVEKKIAKPKSLLKKGLEQSLAKEECNQIERCLQNEPYAVLNFGILPEHLGALIKHNSYMAIIFLLKLAQYPIIAEYFDCILSLQLSFNTIDVVSRLVKVCRLPQEFLLAYTLNIMKQAQGIPQSHKDRQKLPRLISKFINGLTNNGLIDMTNYLEELDKFINCFMDIDEVKTLIKLQKKT